MRRTSLLALALLALPACTDEPTRLLAPGEASYVQSPTAPVVNSLADPGDGTCDESECTLREAIAFAGAGAEITFQASLTESGPATITLAQPELLIDKSLTISGPGADRLSVTRDASISFGPIIWIGSAAVVSISGLTITGGRFEVGGGIVNQGTLTLAHSTVSGNTARGSSPNLGGGIYNLGSLTLAHSTVSGNSAVHGGGIYNDRGTLTITHSTVSDNVATGDGGGIFSATAVDFVTTSTSIINSTVSGNWAGTRGGGVFNRSGLTRILHSTISGNSAESGGGVWSWNNQFARTDVQSSIIVRNTLLDGTTANDVGALETGNRYNSLGYNLIGAAGQNVDFTQEFDQTGDQTGVAVAAAALGPLADNGGPTRTHALLVGSSAIDAGDPNFSSTTLLYDQRGTGYARVSGGRIDIGAFELQQSALVFGGFLPPVSATEWNQAKARQAVPIRFSLGGDFGLEVLAEGYPRSVPLDCGTGDPIDESDQGEPTDPAGKGSLSYDAESQTYTYVWKTEKAWADTCRALALRFSGEATEYTARFAFSR